MAKMTGLCSIKLNGANKRSKPGATLKPGGAIREPVTDSNGVCGLAVKEYKPGEIKFTIQHGSDEDVVALQNLEGVTALFETDSGQRYMVRDAGTVGEVEIKGNEVELTLAGQPAERV
ncbi:phage tail tube protein [Chromobacterium haemolyticum]|uniref:Phage tail protein n=1 Tax=Chromobacterium haemolyticum TaxID=394935 RepID=A0A1W0DAJ6_9NEIS|nr:phage tail tube protein [Chromobacterium haemolyticum]OQS44027.1 hypothetical protein B0T45_00005 [Chromobacterium haemolyticum]